MATSSLNLVAIKRLVQINQTTAGNQSSPKVAGMADGSFVTAYNDGTGRIRMRRFSADGTAMGDELLVSGGVAADWTPHLARLSDGRLVVSWSDDVGTADNVAMRIYSAALQPLTEQTRVNPAGTLASSGTVTALTDGSFVIAYELQKSATDHDVYVQRYDDAGIALGEPMAVDTSTAYSSQIAAVGLSDGGFVIAFSNFATPDNQSGSSLLHAIVNADGSLRLPPTMTDAATNAYSLNASPALAALPDGKALLSYVNNQAPQIINGGITTAIVNADGTIGTGWSNSGGWFGTAAPALSVSPTGYVLSSYTNIEHGNGSVILKLYGPDGFSSITGRDVPSQYNAVVSDVVWLDESRAVNVYMSSVDSETGRDITADLWQLERNTTGAATSETIWLDGLADRVTMGGGDDGVFAGDGNNTVNLGAGNDMAVGGSGPDALIGGAGVDWLYGMGGADYLYGGSETDALMGGDGNDFLFGEDGDDYAFGDAGNDAISGGAGVDRLYGGIGNDTIDGGSETDALSGEDGSDQLFGGTGDDYLFGGADADTLFGGTGNDLLSGDAGNDVLVGETGSDWLIGGAGADVFQFQGLDTGIDTIVDFTPGTDSVLLVGTARTSAADAMANLVQSGANTVLMTSTTSGIIFLNTQVSQFTGGSFVVA